MLSIAADVTKTGRLMTVYNGMIWVHACVKLVNDIFQSRVVTIIISLINMSQI